MATNNKREIVVTLPPLIDHDVQDMARVLTAITDAFIAHHQEQLRQQCRCENQPDLFDDDDLAPF